MSAISATPNGRLTVGARRRTEDLLCRVGAYSLARNTYQRAFNREHFSARREDREFFRQFVAAGALVFDIGANEGRMTEMFTELGARVVALEPNPDLARRVRSRYGSKRVQVEASAVGAEAGTAELLLGRDHGHSTLSAEWQAAVGDEAGDRWSGAVRVPVTTLADLIARHGKPAFVKIDVEGFEPQVLAGLDQPVPALSFEFQCRALEIARESVSAVAALGPYEFNLAHGESHELPADGWTGAAGVLERLAAAKADALAGYGDVYARLPR